MDEIYHTINRGVIPFVAFMSLGLIVVVTDLALSYAWYRRRVRAVTPEQRQSIDNLLVEQSADAPIEAVAQRYADITKSISSIGYYQTQKLHEAKLACGKRLRNAITEDFEREGVTSETPALYQLALSDAYHQAAKYLSTQALDQILESDETVTARSAGSRRALRRTART